MRCADLAHRFSPFSEKKVYGKMMLGKRGTAMHREPFQNQLRRSFIGYVAAILALILLLYLGGFALNFFAVIVRGCRRDNEALETALTQQLAAYDSGAVALTGADALRRAVKSGERSDCLEANRLLYDFTNQQELRAYFVLLGADMQVRSSNFSAHNQSIFASSAFAAGAAARMQQEPAATLRYVCTAPVSSEQACTYTVCRAVPDESGAAVGYLLLNLRQEGFRDAVRDTDSEVLLTDRYDNLIYTTLDPREDPQDKQLSNKFSLSLESDGILALDGSRYYAVCGTVGPQALRLYTLTSLDVQLRMLLYSVGLFVVLLLLLTGVVVAMTKAFTRQNAMELGELTAAVEKLSQNGGAEALPPQCSEESQALYTRFRELIAHNDELLDRRRQMEIKHLEEQFNPHFVYNVMETVRYQISEDPETASEMLLSFASLMRYSVNYGHTKVSLETDVEYVNDYLLLQKTRYNNCLLYEFDIPEELLECRVPKLLLQPVIENSIVHGYRAGQTLHICVQAEHRDDTLRFTVTDDGAGIPTERLAELRESFERDLTNEYTAHVGLYNIQKVIRLTYGAPYGVQIESTEGQGTAVALTIPYEVEENEEC